YGDIQAVLTVVLEPAVLDHQTGTPTAGDSGCGVVSELAVVDREAERGIDAHPESGDDRILHDQHSSITLEIDAIRIGENGSIHRQSADDHQVPVTERHRDGASVERHDSAGSIDCERLGNRRCAESAARRDDDLALDRTLIDRSLKAAT